MQRAAGCVLVCFLMIATPGFAQPEETPPTDEAMGAAAIEAVIEPLMEMFVGMKAEIEELRSRIQVLEQTIGDTTGQTEDEDFGPDGLPFESRGADASALNAIQFPANPTEVSVREYIHKILEVSEKQNSFASDDPQIRMLTRVGQKYAYLLVDRVGESHMLEFYLIKALNDLVRDEHKRLILEQLSYRHALVEVVLERGWSQDARTILIQELNARGQLPTAWYEAVAELKEPSTYDALLKRLVNEWDRLQIYAAIKNLPGIQLDKAVADSWARAKNDPYQRGSFAPIAAQYGDVEALSVVFDDLNNPTSHYLEESPRQFVLRMTDATGSNAELRAWYDANRTTIRFDAAAKKFRAR